MSTEKNRGCGDGQLSMYCMGSIRRKLGGGDGWGFEEGGGRGGTVNTVIIIHMLTS